MGGGVAEQHSEIQIVAKPLEAEDCVGITHARKSRAIPASRIAAGLLRSGVAAHQISVVVIFAEPEVELAYATLVIGLIRRFDLPVVIIG